MLSIVIFASAVAKLELRKVGVERGAVATRAAWSEWVVDTTIPAIMHRIPSELRS